MFTLLALGSAVLIIDMCIILFLEALDIDSLNAEPSPFKRGGQLTRVRLEIMNTFNISIMFDRVFMA